MFTKNKLINFVFLRENYSTDLLTERWLTCLLTYFFNLLLDETQPKSSSTMKEGNTLYT